MHQRYENLYGFCEFYQHYNIPILLPFITKYHNLVFIEEGNVTLWSITVMTISYLNKFNENVRK